VGHARGEIEVDGNVLVIKRIHVTYTGVDVPPEKRETADRALASHPHACPVSRSIEAGIAITSAWG
jgi:uncharacterized OsmC-like protein